jgi:uncharacterized cupin superfamily protein
VQVSFASVNIETVELDHALDEPGFRHRGTPVGHLLGARRMGAGVYEAEAGVPIWPYHYHLGIEEWLYVIAGAPVLRDPAGERTLAPGDVIRFPSGHLGAHTVAGPGRFVIFDTGHDLEPYMCVYPDSDKISVPGGILRRSSAVGYWHGEGSVERFEPADAEREPETAKSQPTVNLLEGSQPLGAGLLAGAVVDLEPGDVSAAYRVVYGREIWILVLFGSPTLRHPGGEDRLEAGDLVCRVEGPDGAHCLVNHSDAPALALVLSTTGLPANEFYPDTGEWLLRHGPGADDVIRLDSATERPDHVA